MDVTRLKEEIVQKLDIQGFYLSALTKFSISASGLKFDSDGWSNKIFCPNHNDNKTPNFAFNAFNGSFRCFACQPVWGGSIFDFWCFLNGLDRKIHFKQSIDHFCDEVGIDQPDWAAYTPASVAPVDASKTPAPRRGFKNVNKAEIADKTKAPIPKSQVEEFQKGLGPEQIKYLNQQRGLKMETIQDWFLGYDCVNKEATYKTDDGEFIKGRYTIPVFGEDGVTCRNIRKYGVYAVKKYKMLNTKGWGSPVRLFGVHLIKKFNPQYVIFCEGEWDCILLNQEIKRKGLETNWVAVTSTHGVTTFEPEWLEHFYGRNIFLCLDVDPPSLAAAASISTDFFLEPLKVGKFTSFKVMRLPLDGSREMNDVSDYFLKYGASMDDFIRLAMNTPHIEPGGLDNDEASVKPRTVDNFAICLKDRQFVDTRVQVPLTISGQTSRIYHAARSYCITSCPLLREGAAGGNCCSVDSKEKTIPYGDDTFILSSMADKMQIRKAIQQVACIYDEQPQISIQRKVVMEEYFAHQVVPRWRAEENANGRMENVQELVTVPLYVLQPEESICIKPQNYLATGWVRSHPKTSAATLFVEHLQPMEDDWLSFKASAPGVIDQLKKLQSFGWESILEQITNGVTYIYDSDHILLTVLLTYLSPLRIIFNGKIERGWINSCIMGDSGTGKSKTYMRLSDWLNLGDLFSVLTGRRTGLLYAVKMKGSEWHVHVGRYVMANKKIIAIDETQEMEPGELKKMAIAMDEGVLEVSQVSSGRYQTESRTIFLMNPRDRFGNARTLSDYAYGCQALRDCFDPMFIRRLDVAIFATGKDNYQFYNQSSAKKKKDVAITADMFRTLIYWAWTRTSNDIQWSEESEQACFKCAIFLSDKFGDADDIPLVAPTDVRLNIARLATAFAVLSCSFTDDFEGVIVTPEHVELVTGFLNTVYSDMTCNLATHSKLNGRKKILTQDEYDKIKANFIGYIKHSMTSQNQSYAKSNFFCQLIMILQNSGTIKRRDLQDQLGLGERWVRAHLNILRMFDLVDLIEGGVKITRKFNKFMQMWRKEVISLDGEREITVDQMLEEVYTKIGENALRSDNAQSYLGEDYRPQHQGYKRMDASAQGHQPPGQSKVVQEADYYNGDEFMPPIDPFSQ